MVFKIVRLETQLPKDCKQKSSGLESLGILAFIGLGDKDPTSR